MADDFKSLFEDLGEMTRRLGNQREYWEKRAKLELREVDKNFAVGGRPRWAPLAPSTIDATGRHRILILSGKLRRSIKVTIRLDGITLYSSLPYSAIHQYGGRHVKARPYLTLPEEALRDIEESLADYLVDPLLH